MKTNSRPGRSGASRISSTTRLAAVSEVASSPRLRNRNVESEVSTALSLSNTKVIRKEQGSLDLGQVCPRLHGADVRDDGRAAGLVPVPLQPRLLRRIAALEHQPASRPQGLVEGPQRCRPLLSGQEDLGHVPGHGHQIDLQGRQVRGIFVQPADAVGAGLAPGDAEGGGGRVDGGHLQATSGEQAGERSCSAADVQDGPGAELVSQSDVCIEIGPVRVQRIVGLREPGSSKIASATEKTLWLAQIGQIGAHQGGALMRQSTAQIGGYLRVIGMTAEHAA